MLSITEITDIAARAVKPTRDVEVYFASGVAEQLEDLEQQQRQHESDLADVDTDLKAELAQLDRDARNSDPRPQIARDGAETLRGQIRDKIGLLQPRLEQLREQAAATLVVFRFTALEGWQWSELTSRSVPRPGVNADGGRYNLDEVTQIAATRSGVRVLDDGTTTPVTTEEWVKIWAAAPAPALERIKIAVWYLNEAGWDEEADAARKASTAHAAVTSNSPTTSVSLPDASPAGNPPPSPSTSTTPTDD